MEVAEAVTVNTVLPDPRYAGTWESIVAADEVKSRILHWALLSLQLRGRLPFETTGLHGLIVLHGPPGTGKTTLARGLPQRLAPLTSTRRVRLIELSPHGLMSAEHGKSQQHVTKLLAEHIPDLASDGLPTVVVLDEVESMAVARSEASLAANPADVHRATDAVLTALDQNAAQCSNLLMVATSNFTGALDTAFLSRADVAIEVPAPDGEGAVAIVRATLQGMGVAFPGLLELAADPRLQTVAARLGRIDGRQIRKAVTEAMAVRLDTVRNPGLLTLADLELVIARAVPTSGAGDVIRKGEVARASA